VHDEPGQLAATIPRANFCDVDRRGGLVTILCLLPPYIQDSGPANMAFDEALLEDVAQRGDVAYLRIYGWIEPTLSLGYFQRMSDALAEPRWLTVPLVRRATGGGAIWHHHDLTYALVLPARSQQARPHTSLYRVVHQAIVETLRHHGIEATRRREGTASEPPARLARHPFLCFTDQDPEDIVFKGFKVVGSAQRRRFGAILQHGSILLRRSDRTPELPGLFDLASIPYEPSVWGDEIVRGVAGALGLELAVHDVAAQVRSRARDFEHEFYRNHAWTGRR
jgi:lipoate-protein ligase A